MFSCLLIDYLYIKNHSSKYQLIINQTVYKLTMSSHHFHLLGFMFLLVNIFKRWSFPRQAHISVQLRYSSKQTQYTLLIDLPLNQLDQTSRKSPIYLASVFMLSKVILWIYVVLLHMVPTILLPECMPSHNVARKKEQNFIVTSLTPNVFILSP